MKISSILSYFQENKYYKDGTAKELLKPGFILSFLLIFVYISAIRITEGQLRTGPVNMVLSQIFLFILCCSSWTAIIYILHEPRIRTNWQKAIASFLTCAFLSTSFYYATNFIAEDYPRDPLSRFPLYWTLFRLINRGFVLGLFFFPTAYFFVKQKELLESRIKVEIAKNAHLSTQLKLLEQQMTPHFLFNSLNVLRSGYNDKWAKKFIVELSNIMRYHLYDNNKLMLTQVTNELQFIQSYIYILQERFETSLQVDLRVSQKANYLKIPPYTIQTLVENAIKHNAMSTSQPLRIEIFDESGYLVVKNNIQPKKVYCKAGKVSEGIGLENIQERYRLLADTSIIVSQDNNQFIVKAPLLANSAENGISLSVNREYVL